MPISKQVVRLINLIIVSFGLFGVIGALLFITPPEGNDGLLKVLLGALITAFVTTVGAKE